MLYLLYISKDNIKRYASDIFVFTFLTRCSNPEDSTSESLDFIILENQYSVFEFEGERDYSEMKAEFITGCCFWDAYHSPKLFEDILLKWWKNCWYFGFCLAVARFWNRGIRASSFISPVEIINKNGC